MFSDKRLFILLALLILVACNSQPASETTKSAPEQAGASVSNPIPVISTSTVEAHVPVVNTVMSTPTPSGYSFDGALSFNKDGSVRITFFLNRTDQRPVFGTAYVYIMINGEGPEDVKKCRFTSFGGQVDCDIPAHFSSLIIKATDAATIGESCFVELPTQLGPDKTMFNKKCAFPIP